jgi:hypothetical protein
MALKQGRCLTPVLLLRAHSRLAGHEGPYLVQGKATVLIGVHRLENSLVGCLPFL